MATCESCELHKVDVHLYDGKVIIGLLCMTHIDKGITIRNAVRRVTIGDRYGDLPHATVTVCSELVDYIELHDENKEAAKRLTRVSSDEIRKIMKQYH